MRQHYGNFVLSPERKICISKLPCTIKFKDLR